DTCRTRHKVSDCDWTSAVTSTQPVVPVATDDAYATSANTALTIASGAGVLSNDKGTGLTKNALVSNVTKGTLSLLADGSFTYMRSEERRVGEAFISQGEDAARNDA